MPQPTERSDKPQRQAVRHPGTGTEPGSAPGRALAPGVADPFLTLMGTPVGTLVRRAPVTIEPGATVRQAAALMSESRISSLLVTQDGFLKVIDFGIARALGQAHRGDTLPGKLLSLIHISEPTRPY